MAPDVSVLIVCRNRRDLLEKALDSVMRQSLSPGRYEILVVDDGSENNSIEKLVREKQKKFSGLRYIRQSPQGLAAGRNFGVKNAKAEIVAFTDSDCIAREKWLEELLERFDSPAVIGVEGKIITDKPRKLFTSAPENLHGNRFIGANSAYRKSVIEKAGYYDTGFGCWRDDSEFALRAMRFGRINFAEKAVIYHPLRKDAFLSMFRYLLYLRNEWVSMFRHGKKFFAYHGREIAANLAKSLKSYVFFLAFLFGLFSGNYWLSIGSVLAKIILDFILLQMPVFKEKIPVGQGEIFRFLLFSFLSWAWELGYPVFFLFSLPAAVFSGIQKTGRSS